jgi:rubrerythrin
MMLTFDGTVLVADDLIFFALFDIIFFAIFIFGYKSTKKRAFEVEQEAEQFKNSLNSSLLFTSSKGVIAEPNAEITYTKFTKPVLVCFECGGYITKQDKFCPNCGDDTKEEFQNLNPT